MKLTRRNWLVLASTLAAALSARSALARGSVVKVSLWDKGPSSMGMLGHGEMRGLAMGKPGQNMPLAMMGVRLSTRTVSAGEVTFDVTNTSKQFAHEMVLSPVKDIKIPLPYDKAANKVDEDAAGHLGEVAELEPGKQGSLKLTLKPGHYILYCNVPGHYSLGMWSLLTVK